MLWGSVFFFCLVSRLRQVPWRGDKEYPGRQRGGISSFRRLLCNCCLHQWVLYVFYRQKIGDKMSTENFCGWKGFLCMKYNIPSSCCHWCRKCLLKCCFWRTGEPQEQHKRSVVGGGINKNPPLLETSVASGILNSEGILGGTLCFHSPKQQHMRWL